MTEQKARKRAVRARMTKTGERYTAARRHLTPPSAQPPLPPRIAEPPHSEESVRRATGKGWDDWFRLLDAWGAVDRPHGEIARYLMEEHGVPGWWAQSVTVGYERARGLRAVHQGSGGFQVGVSKTVGVPVERLYRAFVQPRGKNRWIEPGTLTRRTSRPPSTARFGTARFDFRDGSSRVVAGFEAKGESKSTVSIQHERLPNREAVEELRAFWRERLARLASSLS
jgi:hypothetical protein